jgi:ADP-heptose:LPS heptosyltransferase
MGLGGYLTWTAVAREIHKKTGKKSLPIEVHGNFLKVIRSSIFENNPHFTQEFCSDLVFPLQLNNPQTNYCKSDTPEKAVHRYDKHIIEQICEFYGITNPQLKCEIYATESEKLKISSLLAGKGLSNFIVIEPQSNDEYTHNKLYPLAKWQIVVNSLVESGHTIVQIGLPRKECVLDKVIDLTGQTSFREAAEVIARSKLFISSEGGLMHAANAVGTKSVILYTGFIHPKMTCYSENMNIWIGKNHGPCGMKMKCKSCEQEAMNHDPEEIINAVKEILK